MHAHPAFDQPRRDPRHRAACMDAGRRRGRPRHQRHGPFGDVPGFFGRGPRAGRGDIRAAILALLAEEPMHGYQIMRELADRSGGVWRASPGSIYPTLQQLQDEGLVRGQEAGAGGRRLFQLTDQGRTAATAATASGKPWEAVADQGMADAVQLRDLVGGVMGAARSIVTTGTAEQIRQAADVLRDARRRLYLILAEEPGEQESTERQPED